MSDSVHVVGPASMFPAGALVPLLAALSCSAEAVHSSVDLSGLWTGSPIGSPKEIMLAQRDGAVGSYSAQYRWTTGQFSMKNGTAVTARQTGSRVSAQAVPVASSCFAAPQTTPRPVRAAGHPPTAR